MRTWNPFTVFNAVLTQRLASLRKVLDSTRDVDYECGYPLTIGADDYRTMYERFSVARRAVQIWPKECWKVVPSVYETEDEENTDFETAVKEFVKTTNLWYYLARTDVMSGIGQYGVLLLGLDDGASLETPVATGGGRRLLYLRPFDEAYAKIDSTESNVNDSRYGWPTMYELKVQASESQPTQTLKVHWTRIVHVADNRDINETHGTPRLKDAYNHLLDMKKLVGGSAEMFWKGGFPGYTFGLDPRLDPQQITIDHEQIKDEIEKYSEGLKRYLNLTGVVPHSLQPQVADPKNHFEVLLKLVATSVDVPYRIFIGSEEARLASSEDRRTWNERVAQRQIIYLTPMVVRPFFDRMIELGVLPAPKKDYEVEWPDLAAPTEGDQAKVAKDRTEAFAAYVRGEADMLMPPRSYLRHVHKYTDEEVDAILKESEEWQREEAERESELEPELEREEEPEEEPVR